MASAGKRHRLVLYARLFGRWRGAALLISLAGAVLWWFAPDIPQLASDLAVWSLLGVAGLGGLLFLYTLVGPLFSYLQCYPSHFRLVLPLFSLAVSYSRIRNVRPTRFAPRRARDADLLEPLRGQTAVAVDLTGFPMPERWLRLWLHPALFNDDSTGFVVLAPDWMALSRELESYRGEWKLRHIQKR